MQLAPLYHVEVSELCSLCPVARFGHDKKSRPRPNNDVKIVVAAKNVKKTKWSRWQWAYPRRRERLKTTTSEERMADKEKDLANMGGIGRLGRPPPRRHRDIETVLDWTNRAELWSYITERNGDGALPTTIRDNVKPEVLQRMGHWPPGAHLKK